MNVYQSLVNGYQQILQMFPVALQWPVTVFILIGLAIAFIGLVRTNVLFIIVIVVFLPVLVPLLATFFSGIWAFFVFLLQQIGVSATP